MKRKLLIGAGLVGAAVLLLANPAAAQEAEEVVPASQVVLDNKDAGVPLIVFAGHEYGTALPDGDRKALLEYLKTLTSDGESPSVQ